MRNNEEFHEYLDDLAEDKFFGEVIFYFQGGNIESSKKSERHTKNELKELQQARKKRKIIVSRSATLQGM